MAATGAPVRESVERLGDAGNVVAILSHPPVDGPAAPRPRGPVLLLNAGVLHRVGPHRLHVRLARTLARAGFPALRMDLSGIGDSRALPEGLRFRDSAVADVRAAIDHLGVPADGPGALLFGICSGADNALAAAEADPRIAGIVLVDPPAYSSPRARLRHAMARLRRGGWVRRLRARLRGAAGDGADLSGSARQPPPREDYRRQLQALVARDVRILAIHTAALGVRNNHADQVFENFPELRGRVDSRFHARANHTFTELAEQDALVEAVLAWCERTFPAE